jgi:hypothetical protein
MEPKKASRGRQVEWLLDQKRCGHAADASITPVDTVGAALAAVHRSNLRLTEESPHRHDGNVEWKACVDQLEKLFTEKRHASSPNSSAVKIIKRTRTIQGALESGAASATP